MDVEGLIRAEITKRQQEIEALRLSLRIIDGTADIRVVEESVVREPREPRVLKKIRQSKSWTDGEIKQLCKLARAGLSSTRIAKEMGRSWNAVRQRRMIEGVGENALKRAGILPKRVTFPYGKTKAIRVPDKVPVNLKWKNWTKGEINTLKTLVARGLSTKEIAKQMGRTAFGIDGKIRKIRKLGTRHVLAKVPKGYTQRYPGRGKSWSIGEINTLKSLCAKGLRNEEISRQMDRTIFAVVSKRVKLGIGRTQIKKKVFDGVPVRTKKRAKSWNRWTKQDEQTLIGMYVNGYTKSQIATRLKRTTPAIGIKLHTMRAQRKI